MDETPIIPEPRRFDNLPDEDRLMLLDELIKLKLLDKSFQVTPEGEAVINGESYTVTAQAAELIGTDIKPGRIEFLFMLREQMIKQLMDSAQLVKAFEGVDYNIDVTCKAVVYIFDRDYVTETDLLDGSIDRAEWTGDDEP